MAATEEIEKEILAEMAANPVPYAAGQVNDVITIDGETRMISVPASEIFFGVESDKDVERKHFRCPKVVGDGIDLSKHQIYISYITSDSAGKTFSGNAGLYLCEDVATDGDDITFSWQLSGNVFASAGFIAFKVLAAKTDGENVQTRWNTVPAIGTVLMTVPDGMDIGEAYPDIVTQLLERMASVEKIATEEAMQGYVNTYLEAHPGEIDETLTDPKKAAPASVVGELKGDLVNQKKTGYLNANEFELLNDSMQIVAGVEYTADNGTVTLNGTATGNSYRQLSNMNTLDNTNPKLFRLTGGVTYKFGFKIVGGSIDGGISIAVVRIYSESNETLANAMFSSDGKENEYTPAENVAVKLGIVAFKERTYNNFTIKPFFYEKYVKSNVELEENMSNMMAELNPMISPTPDLSLFERIAVIGNSFASGANSIYRSGHSNNAYNLSWLQILGRKHGCLEAVNYSRGGATSYSWLHRMEGETDSSYKAKFCVEKFQADTPKQLYFVALGINDSNPAVGTNVPLGTIADFDNTSFDGNTFYGNLGIIYRMVLDKNSVAVFCFITIPRFDNGETVRYEPYSEAIRNIASHTNSMLIDCENIPLFRSDYWLNNLYEGHPTAMMYSMVAAAFDEAFVNAMIANTDYLKYYDGYM